MIMATAMIATTGIAANAAAMAAGTVRATKTTMRVEMQNDGHWGVC